MNERMSFVVRLQDGERMTDLCAEFGISRKTGYKLWKRFEAEGARALYDRSMGPKHIPHRTSQAVRKLLVGVRMDHPTWGPKKIRAWLLAKHRGASFPAPSTIGQILKEEGLVSRRTRQRRGKAKPTRRITPTAANQLWCADFKGQFRLGNGKYCYPLTITDAYSRFLVACVGLESTSSGPSQTVFEDAFRTYGMPESIRTDNGAPFASNGLAGLSSLSAWWMRLRVRPERIQPGHPEQNGQHERMHLTLKQETTRPAEANILRQQERFDSFIDTFNNERPHEALEQKPPATRYTASARNYEHALTEPDYPLHDLVLKVSSSGSIWLPQRRCFYISTSLAGQPIGVKELDDGRWNVHFMDLELGHLVEGQGLDPADGLL